MTEREGSWSKAELLVRLRKYEALLARVDGDAMGGTPDLFWPVCPCGERGNAAWERFWDDVKTAVFK